MSVGAVREREREVGRGMRMDDMTLVSCGMLGLVVVRKGGDARDSVMPWRGLVRSERGDAWDSVMKWRRLVIR